MEENKISVTDGIMSVNVLMLKFYPPSTLECESAAIIWLGMGLCRYNYRRWSHSGVGWVPNPNDCCPYK